MCKKKARKSTGKKKNPETIALTPQVKRALKLADMFRGVSENQIREALKITKTLKGLSEHHVVPVSRGGKDGNGNKKNMAGKYHTFYHYFFDNMTPEEAEFFVKLLMRGRKKTWRIKEIELLREQIMEGNLIEAMNLSQFTYKQQDELARKFLHIIEKRKQAISVKT